MRKQQAVRKPSLRRMPTVSMDAARRTITWQMMLQYAVRFTIPPTVWAIITRVLSGRHVRETLGIDDQTRIEILALSNNYLAAIGLLYAIYLGITFQTAADRLRDLRSAISSEASGLQSVAELSLTLSRPTFQQRAAIHSVLLAYVDHVLSRELRHGLKCVRLSDAESYTVISDLYGLFAVFKELAANGHDDSVDLRTLDALHDEIRDLVRARAERLNLTNFNMPMIHWVVLLMLSVLTVLGVAINDLPTAPWVSASLSAVLGCVVPLSYLIVADMSKPFSGAWSVSDQPLRGVRSHVLPRLARASSTAVGAEMANGAGDGAGSRSVTCSA